MTSPHLTDLGRIVAFVGIAVLGLLTWVASEFGTVPRRLSIVEEKVSYSKERLDRMEGKLDRILDAVKR